jgi:lysophospholipase L1-like esterase
MQNASGSDLWHEACCRSGESRSIGYGATLGMKSRWTLAAAAALAVSAGLIGWLQTGFVQGGRSVVAHVAAARSIVMVQEVGSAPNLEVTEAKTDPLLEGVWQPLAATIIGRVVTSLPEPISPTEGDRQGLGIRHDWPAIYARARFSGDTLFVGFDDSLNRYRITFDDGAGPILLVTQPERRTFRVSGLGSGPHAIRIDKISESPGVGSVAGLYVPADGDALPVPPSLARQIEFIGDSDSVGYGNTSSTRDCTGDEVFLLTDTQQSFGPQIARHFGADYQLIAASGIGVVRNHGGASPGRTMPVLYHRRLRDEPEYYAPDGWAPQVIVLALGSNDFDSPMAPGEPWNDRETLRQEFEAQYVRFLQDLRASHPQAFLLLAMWPQYGSDYIAAHEAILRALRAAGDTRTGLIGLPKMDRSGCHWHPSLGDHRKAAQGIIGYLAARQGVWGSD